MRRFLTLFALALALTSGANAQTAARDSLIQRLALAKEDSAAVRLYFRIGDMTENADAPKAREYYGKAIGLSRKLHDTIKIIQSLNYYGGSFMISGQTDSLLYYIQLALPLARQIRNPPLIGQCLFNIGLAYRDLFDFDNAIKYCLEGKPMLEANGSIGTFIEINNALLGLYTAKNEYEKAIPYGETAVRLSREMHNQPKLAECLINLSMPYTETHRLEKARSLLLEARQLAIELQDDRILLYVIMNLANVAIKTEDFIATKKYSEEALPLERKVGAEEAEGTTLRALALCYIQEKNYAKAKEYTDQSLLIVKKINNIREEAAGMRVLSSIHYATGDVLNGYRISVRSDSILDKMVTDQLTGKATELEKKYETEKKEIRIRELEAEKKVHQLTIRQKSILNYVLIGSAVFLAILFILLYRNYRQKQRLQQQRIIELETEKRLTATEAVLKGEEQERTRLARELHDGLGGMLSGIKYSFKTMQGNLIMTPDNVQAFERSMDMLDSSIKEMRRVAHNMMPEALVKFGLDAAIRDFCNDITKSGALEVSYVSLGLENMIIEQTMAITIYRIVQELLNNTMKHAGAKTAIVQVMKSGSQLSVTVEDNGKGFDTKVLQRAEGIGWTNIRNRVEFLKGQLNVQADEGKGTSVHIELPH